jgi:hypothetical protein
VHENEEITSRRENRVGSDLDPPISNITLTCVGIAPFSSDVAILPKKEILKPIMDHRHTASFRPVSIDL